MKVSQILQSKGAEVFTVTATMLVRDAIGVLAERNIGAVVVKDPAGRVAGIFSERDVVRKMNAEGQGALARPVDDCMTKEPITCDLEASIDEVMSLMTERRIRHIPVVVEGELVGIVSIGDVVKRKIDHAEREAAALKEYIAS
ncbi:MAG: CBS domain-containing protein [Parvularculaceae bacterium]